MVYSKLKTLSMTEIDYFSNATDIRQIQCLSVRLVDEQCEYEPETVAEYAARKGYASRLGYLVDISIEAASNLHLTNGLDRAKRLAEMLYAFRAGAYEFLAAFNDNDHDNKALMKLDKKRSTHKLNKKWKVYSSTHTADIEDYIELYLIDLRQGNHLKVCNFDTSAEQLKSSFHEFLELAYGA